MFEITKFCLFFWWSAEITCVYWTLSLRKVVQSLALYCAVWLLIRGNYWYAGLSVCAVDPWTLLVRWTVILRKGPVGAKNAQTVLFRQTLQRTVRYLWSISEVLYQSAGLFESSARYSSIAKHRPNEKWSTAGRHLLYLKLSMKTWILWAQTLRQEY